MRIALPCVNFNLYLQTRETNNLQKKLCIQPERKKDDKFFTQVVILSPPSSVVEFERKNSFFFHTNRKNSKKINKRNTTRVQTRYYSYGSLDKKRYL